MMDYRYRVMMNPRNLAYYIFMPVFLALAFISPAQDVPSAPAVLMGVVTNGAGGQPVIGAKITVNGRNTFSTTGGLYSLSVDPVGTYPVVCSKAGFDTFNSAPVVFQSGVTAQLNIALWETLVPPYPVTAVLDTVTQSTGISWNPPDGKYELLYDDGIQDNFTIWALQGNMNAVKFTPVGFPVKVTGGSIHIGTQANYPSGSALPVSFQVSVFDASGSGGAPGNSIAGPFPVTLQSYGWIEFTFPSPVTVNAGSFYLAMTQVGGSATAAGLAIDETAPQFRSYSKFVSGSSPWIPAGGNFMIRAQCQGPGGPVFLADEPSAPLAYNIYRLRQGEEQNPSVWSLLANTATTNYSDASWPSLPCGPYRWGIKTSYPGNRWAATAFSNIIGKCWTAPVTLQVIPSCQSIGPSGTSVQLVNVAYPDTVYSSICDTTGIVTFPRVWKGTYSLTASKFGYDTLIQNLPVTTTVTQVLNILQIKNPPANLVVNDSSLLAHWDVPHFEKPVFSENWSSNSFATQGWSVQGSTNWYLSSTVGNPAPCAVFNSLPPLTSYSQSLTSRTISGQRSVLLKLRYDILLDNAGTTTVNQMAVEIWNGTTWNTLKTYSSSGGTFPWTRDELDISSCTNLDFRIRFRAFGGSTLDIDHWELDNIDIVASDPPQQQANCILGYYFYLGNAIVGYTTKNACYIPADQVQYGQTYTACVRALYGSGYSDSTCTAFSSHFLYPVRNIQGVPVENVAFISWEKPQSVYDTLMVTPPGLIGYNIYRDDSLIAQINNVDSLSYYDINLDPGLYKYGVSARYDLAFYGFPGQTGESLQDGPLNITITFGLQLPFFESWDHGTFSFNEWKFSPSQGNWTIDLNEGLPSPAASFKWQPPRINYSYALESPPFNGVPFNCAAIWLDFDVKLNDRNATETEKLIVEAYYNHEWHKKAEIRNAGNLSWTNYHIDISPVRGMGFRIRFRATGENSSEILNWFVDNISVYPVCYPASGLKADPAGYTVNLTWSPPACFGGNLMNEGFEENFFPPSQWTKQSTNAAASWSHISANNPTGVHNGTYAAGLDWDYNHQDEWLIATNIYVNGDLTFWSYAFQGSLHLDHYYLQVSVGQSGIWDVLMDMSNLPAYPGPGGVNNWNTPYHVDLSAYAGETVDIAWHAVDGDGQGLWYPWAIDDCSIGADDHSTAIFPQISEKPGSPSYGYPGNQLMGYDIYRKQGLSGNFVKLNPVPVTDTAYQDPGLQPGQYRYFVQSRFDACEYSANSDTVLVDVIAGCGTLADPSLAIFPNPASDHITVSSAEDITGISLLSATGICEESWPAENVRSLTLNTAGIRAGIHVLQVRRIRDVKNYKICIVK